MRFSWPLLTAGALFFCAGCISYDYDGESAGTPTEKDDIGVYTEAERISSPYRVLGKATVSGDYQQVSRERMIEKLKTEASKCGANAILIVEQQVVPSDTLSGRETFQETSATDDNADNWASIHRDVDGNYGNVRHAPKGGTTLYRRTIQAQFLRFETEK